MLEQWKGLNFPRCYRGCFWGGNRRFRDLGTHQLQPFSTVSSPKNSQTRPYTPLRHPKGPLPWFIRPTLHPFRSKNGKSDGTYQKVPRDLPKSPAYSYLRVDLVNLRQHPSIWILKTSFRIPKGHFLVYRPCIEKSVVVEATNFDCKSLWIVRVRARLCAAGRSLMHH